MPKKNKVKQRSRPGSFPTNYIGEAQIFRNSFAVFDGADPQISLKYMKDMFKEKLDEDVITMIFSECAYDVDQALETLISLSNDNNISLDPEKKSTNSFNSKETEYSQEEPHSISDLNMNNIRKHFDKKHFLGAIQNVPTFKNSNFSSQMYNFSSSSVMQVPMPDKQISEDCTDSAQKFNETGESRGKNDFPFYSNITSQSPKFEHYKQIECNRFSSPPYGCYKQNDISNSDPSGSISSVNQFELYDNHPKFVTPMMPMSSSLKLCSKPIMSYRSGDCLEAGRTTHYDQSVRNVHSIGPTQYEDNKYEENKEKIIERIKSGKRILIILRGLPGSGKSTLGQQLRFAGVLYSTDDYFVKNGFYKYDFQKLNEAHEWNKARTKKALKKSITPIIIDNTNVEAWELTPYVHMALRLEYEVYILEPNTPWKFSPKELSLKNKHYVSREKIKQMLERYQHNVTVDTITKYFRPKNYVQREKEKEVSASVVTKSNNSESTDNYSETINPPTSKNNFIKLEVDVHQEDNFESYKSLESKHDNIPELNLNTQINSLNGNKLVENIDNLSNDQKITDLNQLRALIQEDSEESQSISIHTSTSDSTQDVSGWEAITEHDDDFLWTTTPMCSITKKVNQSEVETQATNEDYKKTELSCFKNSERETPMKGTSHSLEAVGSANSFTPHLKSFDHKNSFLENSVDSKPLKNDMVSENEQIKSAHELFRTDFSIKCGSGSSGLYGQQSQNSIETDSSVFTWGEWGVHETGEEGSVSPMIKNISNASNDVNSFNPKPQRKMSGSDIPLKDLFRFKPKENLFEASGKVVRNTSASNDSWRKSSQLNDEVFAVEDKNSKSFDPKPDLQETEKIVAADHVNSTKVEGNAKLVTLPSNVTSSVKGKKFKYIASKKSNNNNIQQIIRSSFENITNDWQFPPYVASESINLKESVKEKNCNLGSSIETQTEPTDFILLHKVETEENCLTDFSVLTSKLKEVTDFVCDISLYSQKDVPQFPSFEKSTCTDDLPCDGELSQKFQHLHECFPDISDEDLNHLFEICHGDDTWLSNLLLEWGYKYNVQKSENLIEMTLIESSPFLKLLNKNNEISSNMSPEDTELDNNSVMNSNSENSLAPETDNSSQSNSSESSSENSRYMSKLHLSLNTEFALQLEELFGPVGDSSCNPTVEIGLELARLIHTHWAETVWRNKENPGGLSEANKASDYIESDNCHGKYKTKAHHLVKNETESKASQEPKPLSEIMDMEYALELHKKEKMKRDSNLVTKIERQELYNMFPGADTIALDEIFESNNYSLKNSIVALGDDIGYPQSSKKKNAAEQKDKNTIENMEGNTSGLNFNSILLDFVNDDWASWVSQEELKDFEFDKLDLNTISSEASDLREQATMHYELRKECINKAQQAFCKGMKEVASFYAQKGDVHGMKFKELNKSAASLIVQERNVSTNNLSLDLHGLYVKEAITTLQRFLKDKKLELKRRQLNCPCTLSIITGQGIHSERGAKLRPSIMEFLKKTGYRFSEITMGVLEITLLPDHMN